MYSMVPLLITGCRKTKMLLYFSRFLNSDSGKCNKLSLFPRKDDDYPYLRLNFLSSFLHDAVSTESMIAIWTESSHVGLRRKSLHKYPGRENQCEMNFHQRRVQYERMISVKRRVSLSTNHIALLLILRTGDTCSVKSRHDSDN